MAGSSLPGRYNYTDHNETLLIMTTLIDDSDVCALLIIFDSGETEEITYVRAPARLLTTSRSSTSAGAN